MEKRSKEVARASRPVLCQAKSLALTEHPGYNTGRDGLATFLLRLAMTVLFENGLKIGKSHGKAKQGGSQGVPPCVVSSRESRSDRTPCIQHRPGRPGYLLASPCYDF